ncbi:MAG: type II toxin-antitoxin system Phd/YefM family antitoxin [Leptospiraceae bacterium]|nr:type II toxin-antitoxin system Phd/YefM family antitoxin [Leptospiraceae bacterium]
MQVNALEIRNSFGGVLKKLEKYDEPIIIEKNRTPVAVLISIETFKNRFVDYKETEKKKEILARFKKNLVKSKKNSTLELKKLRNDLDT